MKKISVLTGMLLAAAMVVVAPASAKAAGMPCTEATIKEFQANLAVAQQELAQVQAAKVQADANVTALRAQGVTGLELLQATDAATNAANVVSAYQHKVSCAQQSLDAIISRGNTEQYVLDYEAKVKDRTKLDAIQVQLDGANQVTSAALTQLKNLQSELVKAQVNAASNPALAGNVTAIQAQVNAAEVAYNQAKANSDALALQYAQAKATLNFATNEDNAAFDAFVRGYATSLRQEYVYTSKNNKGEDIEKSKLYYPNRNKNSNIWESEYYGQGVINWAQPNEWAVRWFE